MYQFYPIKTIVKTYVKVIIYTTFSFQLHSTYRRKIHFSMFQKVSKRVRSNWFLIVLSIFFLSHWFSFFSLNTFLNKPLPIKRFFSGVITYIPTSSVRDKLSQYQNYHVLLSFVTFESSSQTFISRVTGPRPRHRSWSFLGGSICTKTDPVSLTTSFCLGRSLKGSRVFVEHYQLNRMVGSWTSPRKIL